MINQDIFNSKIIFIVGAPRSGTTWLQMMISDHPHVTTTIETPIFYNYVQNIISTWESEKTKIKKNKETRNTFNRGGLPLIFSEDEFTELLHSFCLPVYKKILAKKPGASIVLDKDPFNSFMINTISRIFPGAKFINIIRDGRDVACSRMAAKKSMQFGEGNVIDAAKTWVQFVFGVGSLISKKDIIEVSYEELVKDTEKTLDKVFDFCDIEADSDLIRLCVERNRFELLKAQRRSPDGDFKNHDGFYRKGEIGTWQQELCGYEQILFARYANDILLKHGYETDPLWYRRNLIKFLINYPIALTYLGIYTAMSNVRGFVLRMGTKSRFP